MFVSNAIFETLREENINLRLSKQSECHLRRQFVLETKNLESSNLSTLIIKTEIRNKKASK